MSIIKSLAGAALPFVGSSALAMGESALAYKGQKDANESNERIARENRTFQERMVNQAQNFEEEMSSSAYQRAMADMKKAGLNPMLAYQQGGASTPIGKTAPGAGAVMNNVFGGMSGSPIDTISSASSIMKQQQEIQNLQSTLLNDQAYRDLNEEQQVQVKETIRKIQAEIDNVAARTTGQMSDNAVKQIIEDIFKRDNSMALFDRLGTGPTAIGIIARYFGIQNLKSAPRGSSYPDSFDESGNWRPPKHYRDQIGIGR